MNELKNMHGEIVLYHTPDSLTIIDVRIEHETIWLSQKQMAELFDCSSDNIGLHLRNIYKDMELSEETTAEEFSVVQVEGKRKVTRNLICYNLDAIISVDYRVNTLRGTQFRIWANSVLKDYLLKGYAIHQRIDRVERKLLEHDQQFELLIRSNLPPNEGIFYEGQIRAVGAYHASAEWAFICMGNWFQQPKRHFNLFFK